MGEVQINCICVPNDVDEAHLGEVIDYMRQHGSARIAVVDCGGELRAVEGSHRIRAAAITGIQVILYDVSDLTVGDARKIVDDMDFVDDIIRNLSADELEDYGADDVEEMEYVRMGDLIGYGAVVSDVPYVREWV